MIKNDLRNPIAKTILLIAVITLIILFSFNAPPGSGIGGTLTAIISGIFTTIKVIIGLAVAFAVSLFLFIVIFALSVAIISREDAVKVINTIFQRLTGKEILRQPEPKKKKPGLTTKFKEIKEKVSMEKKGEKVIEKDFGREIEEKSKNHLEKQIQNIQRLNERMAEDISSLKSKFSLLKEEILDLKDEQREGNLEENINEIKMEVNGLRKEIGKNEKEVEQLKKQLAEVTSKEKKGQEIKFPEGEHRIFEYLERESDCHKLRQLTEKTVQQGMSYADAINYITSNMPKEAANIVEAHPVLTKEFIKSCRDLAAKS